MKVKGEGKKRKTPDARARERVHFLQANVTFLIAVGKRNSKAKNTIFIFSVFISIHQLIPLSLPTKQ